MERDKALIEPAHKRFACVQEVAGACEWAVGY